MSAVAVSSLRPTVVSADADADAEDEDDDEEKDLLLPHDSEKQLDITNDVLTAGGRGVSGKANLSTSAAARSGGNIKVGLKEESAKVKRKRLRAEKKAAKEAARKAKEDAEAALMTPEEVKYKQKAERDKLKKKLAMPFRESYFRDLRFKILDAFKVTYPKLLERHPKPLYMAVNYRWPVSTVITRISAMIKTSTRRIRLVFCGATLDPDDYIPEDAFESLVKLPGDDDYFRPRIFVALKNIPEDDKSVSGEDDEEDDEEDDDDDDEEEEEKKNENEDEDAELLGGFDNIQELELQGARGKLNDRDENPLDLQGMQLAKFDLKQELKLIECEQYYVTIFNAGYTEMGSFSNLDEDRLTRPDCYVAKRSRIRILALADALKRKIAVMDKDTYSSAKDKIERDQAMKNGKMVRGLGEEAGGELFTNKAAINRHWAKKAKEDEKKRLEELERLKRAGKLPDPMSHPKDLQEKIDFVKMMLHRDEFDYPVNMVLPPPHVEFCCEKHKDSSLSSIKLYFKAKNEANETEIKAMMVRIIEQTKVEVISREILKVVSVFLIKKNGHVPDDFDVNSILDQCIMVGDVQVERSDWKNEVERREKLGKIPVPNYDVIKFMALLIEYINQKNVAAYT